MGMLTTNLFHTALSGLKTSYAIITVDGRIIESFVEANPEDWSDLTDS